MAFLADAPNSEDATTSNTWPFHALKAAELSPKSASRTSPRSPFLDQAEASNGFLDYFQIAENPGAIASWHES